VGIGIVCLIIVICRSLSSHEFCATKKHGFTRCHIVYRPIVAYVDGLQFGAIIKHTGHICEKVRFLSEKNDIFEGNLLNSIKNDGVGWCSEVKWGKRLYDVLGGFPYNRINPEGNCLLSGLFQKLCIIRLQG
jgi:hypothetical protein